MIAQRQREQQFRGPRVTGLNDSSVASASWEEPFLASRPGRGLAPRGKAPELARWAVAAPPSLRGRGSRARRASSETAGRAAGPGQAGHAGPTGSRDSAARGTGERCGAASRWPGLLGQHAAASRLHGAAHRWLPAYDRAGSDFLLQTLMERPPPSFPSFPGFLRVFGDQDGPGERRPS